MRWIWTFLFSIFAVPSFAKTDSLTSTLKVANPRGAIGEMGTMGLWEPGFHLTNENDFLGNTDKLVTQTSSAHVNTLSEKGYSFDFAYQWRLVTPIEETRIDQPNLEPPVGPFIDWEEYSVTAAQTKMWDWGGIKIQATLGYHAMRDNYGRSLLRWTHKITGNLRPELGPSLASWHWGGGLEANYLSPPLKTGAGNEFAMIAGAGWNQNGHMDEAYLRMGIIAAWSRGFKLGVEGVYARQFYSSVYGSLIKKERYEAGFSIVLTPYWRTGIKYVTPYLTSDRYGQYYFEIIGLNIPF